MKARSIAHSNIALVKYWGKRDNDNNIPATGSISVTLSKLFTETAVEFSSDIEEDEVILNGSAADRSTKERVSRFLDLIRERAGMNQRARVESRNNFPTGAGLASSASGFAALAVAASWAAGLELPPSELSRLARRGSGSAARSILGGFVEMKAEGDDPCAVQLADENYWPLRLLLVITSEEHKRISSRNGMLHTQQTSPYYSSWVASTAADLEIVREAIRVRDFERLGQTAEHSCLKMHASAMAANPGILYWNGTTVDIIQRVIALRKSGIPAYFTIDAGPQVKILTTPEFVASVEAEIRKIDGVLKIYTTSLGPNAKRIGDEH